MNIRQVALQPSPCGDALSWPVLDLLMKASLMGSQAAPRAALTLPKFLPQAYCFHFLPGSFTPHVGASSLCQRQPSGSWKITEWFEQCFMHHSMKSMCPL